MFIFHCPITPYFTSLVLNKYALNSFIQQICEYLYYVRQSSYAFQIVFLHFMLLSKLQVRLLGSRNVFGEVNSFLTNLFHTLSFGNDFLYVFSCYWNSFFLQCWTFSDLLALGLSFTEGGRRAGVLSGLWDLLIQWKQFLESRLPTVTRFLPLYMCVGIQMAWLNIASPGSRGNAFQQGIWRISHMTPININGGYQGIPHIPSCKCNPNAY